MSILFGGPTPQDGKSAYEIAIENGFVGTEAQWLASLKGTQGTSGSKGADGKDGDSAYQIWLKNGHSGTQAQFLSWLRASNTVVGKAEIWNFGIDTSNSSNITSASGYYTRIGQLVTVAGLISFNKATGALKLPFKSATRVGFFTLAHAGDLEESPAVRGIVQVNSDVLTFAQVPAVPVGFAGFRFGFCFTYITWPTTAVEGPSSPII